MAAAKSKKTAPSPEDLLRLAMEIIAETGWSGFSFSELAARAGTTLAEIRKSFRSRQALLDALTLRLDEAMLSVDPDELADLPPRDRVFELMMSRLEAMAPFRFGLIRIAKDAAREPELALTTACRVDRSMGWLREAAGLGSNGLRGRVQRHLLTGLYAKTLRTWIDDDSTDLAKTMASLDKDLRRIENFAGLSGPKR